MHAPPTGGARSHPAAGTDQKEDKTMSRGRGNTNQGHHGPSQRQLRVGEEIRHALSEILQRGDFRDPALQDVNVTVTEVRISPDLKNATAFVVPLGGGDPAVIAALNHAGPFFRSQIARSVRLQFAPRISFQADTSFDYADRIDRLLHQPEVARDLDAEGVPLDRDDRLDDDADDGEPREADDSDEAGRGA